MSSTYKNAIILCRVSTTEQAKKGDSLDDQSEICSDYCQKNNINAISIFKEEVSGTKGDRDKIHEMKRFIKAFNGKIDFLVVMKIDRFSRVSVGEYEKLKNEFLELGTQLIDVYGVINTEEKFIEVKGINYKKYGFLKLENSKLSETLHVALAELEGKTILQRTLVQEMELSKRGYTVGKIPYGYEIQKTKDDKKLSILAPRAVEKEAIKHMYEWRAEGKPDVDIAKEISVLYKKKSGKNFEVKDIQRMMLNTKYAGVYEGEWTGMRAIGIKCTKSIVSIDTFNKANRGKMKIIDLNETDKELGVKLYEILYKSKENDTTWNDDKITEKKIKNIENKNFPYTKLVYSPYGKKLLSGSISIGRKGDESPNYHATIFFANKELFRGNYQFPENITTKGQYFGQRKEIFEKTINDFLSQIKPVVPFMELYKEYLKQIWKSRRVEIQELNQEGKLSIVELENEATRISKAITRLAELAGTDEALKMKNQELVDIKNHINQIKNEEKKNDENIKKAPNLEDFMRDGIFLLEHIREAFINAENYNQRKFIFDVIFDSIPYYDDIAVGTQKLSPLWSYIKQNSQKKSESFKKKRRWLPELDSNQGPTG